MTASRDPDRLVRAWLDLMPSEAPDRVVDAVLQAVETAPQARPPIGVAIRRPFPMNRLSLTAVAVAIVVVLAGGALVLTRFSAPQVAASPPPSSVAPSASPTNAIPAALLGRWLGANRPALGSTGAPDLLIDDHSALITQDQGHRLGSAASIENGRLKVQLNTSVFGCQAQDTGTYTISLSPSGETLRLTDGQDACATRLNAISGAWYRDDCRAPEGNFCLGLVDAGTYATRYFHAAGSDVAGELSFTVPDGWANAFDFPGLYKLAPAADFSAASTPDADPAATVKVMAVVAPESQASPCSSEAQPGVAATPAAFLAWLHTVPGLSVLENHATTVDGRPAISVDLSVRTAPAATCDGGAQVIEYIVSDGWGTGPYTNGLTPSAKDRLLLFEVDGNLTAVIVGVADASRFDTFVQQAMPIVSTFHFK